MWAVDVDRERDRIFSMEESSVERMTAWSGFEEKTAIQKNYASALLPPQAILLDKTRTNPNLLCPYQALPSHKPQMAGYSRSFASRPHQFCFSKPCPLISFVAIYLCLMLGLHTWILSSTWGTDMVAKNFIALIWFFKNYLPNLLVCCSFSLLNICRFCLFVSSLWSPEKRTIFQNIRNRSPAFYFTILHWSFSQHYSIENLTLTPYTLIATYSLAFPNPLIHRKSLGVW